MFSKAIFEDFISSVVSESKRFQTEGATEIFTYEKKVFLKLWSSNTWKIHRFVKYCKSLFALFLEFFVLCNTSYKKYKQSYGFRFSIILRISPHALRVTLWRPVWNCYYIETYDHFHKTLRHFDVLPNFLFTTSETMLINMVRTSFLTSCRTT